MCSPAVIQRRCSESSSLPRSLLLPVQSFPQQNFHVRLVADALLLSKLPGAFDAPAGSVITMVTPGSGGFGPPAERDQAAIARDLREGYVSTAHLEREYGIAAQALRKAAATEDDR